jgi:CRP-like cAMP-binding protein
MSASGYLEKGLGIKLDKDIADIINSEVSFIEFPCKHIVLLEGMKAINLYYIISGVIRGYYIDEEGNDITKCFCSENEFFCSEGLRTTNVSSFTIECLETCRCIQVPYELLHRIIDKDESLKNFFIEYYLKEVGKLESRAKCFALMDAEERYIDFIKQYPQLHERVELKYIASYLGIRAASLSRIRKKVKNIF